jgi:hypothetical protein
MTNKNLMESTVTRNMTGRRRRDFSNADGQETIVAAGSVPNSLRSLTHSTVSKKIIQEPVAGVGTAINSTTAPETIDPREVLLAENTITPKEESTIAEIPVTEDSRTQETTVMTKRPMEVKKGITEGQKNLLIFAGAVFAAAAIVYVVKNYAPVKG